MSPSGFCKCGSAICGNICCKTEQDPKKCSGVWKNGLIGLLKSRRKNNDGI